MQILYEGAVDYMQLSPSFGFSIFRDKTYLAIFFGNIDLQKEDKSLDQRE